MPHRAIQYVGTPDENGCCKWGGDQVNPQNGRPQIYDPRVRRTVFAARLILEYKLGRPLGQKMCACHSCDNAWCVNPDHLWEGTNKDNAADTARKKRSALGARNGQAKLSEDQILSIKADERTHKDIAMDYGVKCSLISMIKRGERWGHIDGPSIINPKWRKGLENKLSKLTAEQVREIRLDGRSSIKACADYGVSSAVVRKVRAGTAYGDVK